MALDLTPFLADVRAEIGLAWPETKPNGILEAEHADMIAWIDLPLPFAVVTYSHFQRAEWGLANLALEALIDIYYVAAVRGASSGIRTKLEALAARFWPNDPLIVYGRGQVLDIEAFAYDDSLYPNQIFKAANRSQRAGMVRVRCLVGQ